MTSQQSFPNFMQLQGVTKLIFYMVLGKFKFLKSVSMEKKSSDVSTQLVFHEKFQKQQLEILKSLFKLFATLGKKNRA